MEKSPICSRELMQGAGGWGICTAKKYIFNCISNLQELKVQNSAD